MFSLVPQQLLNFWMGQLLVQRFEVHFGHITQGTQYIDAASEPNFAAVELLLTNLVGKAPVDLFHIIRCIIHYVRGHHGQIVTPFR